MSLFGIFERRNIENPTFPLTSQYLADWLGGGSMGPAGVAVTPKSALTMSAVYRSVALISGVSAALPLHAYKPATRDKVNHRLLADPHVEMTAFEFWRLTYVHRCMWGNFYAQKVKDNAGRVVWLNPLMPDDVQVGRVKKTRDNPSGKIFAITVDGQQRPYTTEDIFHIPGFGYDGQTGASPIRLAANGIGLGLAAEEYGAKLFGSGALMAGVLQTEQRLEQEQAEALQNRWQSKMQGLRNAHKTAVLDSGAKWQSITMPNTDAQFLESRAFQAGEVGRFFGVPPFLMGLTEKSTSWGTGLEQQAQGWVTFDLHPQWLAPTEQRVAKYITPGLDAKYTVQALLRGDSAARAAFYRVMREVGAFSANDIRDLEDQPPIENGDTYLQPTNLAPLGSQPDPNKGGTP